MAGIGFEITKILKRRSLLSAFEAYSYAGLIGSGPWVLSILAMTIVGLMSLQLINTASHVITFLVAVTYLMAGSLILTGGLQLMLTRFMSDTLFKQKQQNILPNLLGSILLVSLVSGCIALLLLPFFSLNPLFYNVLMAASFVCLSNLWMVIIFLSGMKAFKRIVNVMAVGYTLFVVLAYQLASLGINGLMLAFFISQCVLLFSFLYFIMREFPANKLIAFDFLHKKNTFYSLFICGSFYNIGVWVDKFVFWFTPQTSEAINGLFRASIIYDVPIFLAYLSIVPGMAVFLVRIETDFAEQHEAYYNAVRGNATLQRLLEIKALMIKAVNRGLIDIIKVQGVVVVILIVWGKPLLQAINIDTAYYPLFCVDLVGVAIQVLFLSVLNVLFYFDKRYLACLITGIFLIANLLLSLMSVQLGTHFYGYGFTLALLIATLLGIALLNRIFYTLEYETYMFQR